MYRGSHVHKNPNWSVLHFPSCVLCKPFCASSVLHCYQDLLFWICYHVIDGASLWCTTFAIKYTAYPIMCIRSLTWVYCDCQQVHWICRCHHVLQEPHLSVRHSPSSVLQSPSCTSGASLECTTFAIKCTTESIMYIRSLTWVYDIRHQVYYRVHHVHQEPHLGVLHLPSSSLHIISFQSGASHGVLYMPTGVLNMPSSNIRNNTGVHFRSLTWVYCICHQVYCRGHRLTSGTTLGCTSGASLGCTTFAIKCTAEAIV